MGITRTGYVNIGFVILTSSGKKQNTNLCFRDLCGGISAASLSLGVYRIQFLIICRGELGGEAS